MKMTSAGQSLRCEIDVQDLDGEGSDRTHPRCSKLDAPYMLRGELRGVARS